MFIVYVLDNISLTRETHVSVLHYITHNFACFSLSLRCITIWYTLTILPFLFKCFCYFSSLCIRLISNILVLPECLVTKAAMTIRINKRLVFAFEVLMLIISWARGIEGICTCIQVQTNYELLWTNRPINTQKGILY